MLKSRFDNKNKPIIIGGGGHARSLIAMAPVEQRPDAYVDFEPTLPLAYLGNDDTFLADENYADYPVIIAYVAPQSCSMAKRHDIIERYANRVFATVVANDAIVEPDCVIGLGTMIFHRAVINTGCFLGDHVIVNTGAIVEHDVSIGSNCFVGPGAIIAGNATVGTDVYIGAGACIRNGVNIVDGCVIGMGAVVVKDITKPGTYVGNPAKLKKQ